MVQMARQFHPQPRQEKYFLLFSVGCFGAYEIHLFSICHIAVNTRNNKLSLKCLQVPVTIQEAGA